MVRTRHRTKTNPSSMRGRSQNITVKEEHLDDPLANSVSNMPIVQVQSVYGETLESQGNPVSIQVKAPLVMMGEGEQNGKPRPVV